MRRMTGRTSSVTSRPLRCRSVGSSDAASARSTDAAASRRARPPCRTRSRRPTFHSTAVTASCNAGARSTSGAAPRRRRCRRASASVSVPGSGVECRPRRTNTRSRYSRVALVPGRQREPEAHLRPRREPLGERERELRDAKRPLERAGDVAVRDPTDLAPLGVQQADRDPGGAPHQPRSRRGNRGFRAEEPHRNVGSLDAPTRSWPVP